MSMVGMVQAVDDAEIVRLKFNADMLTEQLAAASAGLPPQRAGFPVPPLDLEKSWHAVHFLLTASLEGSGSILDFLVDGGEEIGDDTGYGPPRAFRADEVAQIARAMGAIDIPDLQSRFQPAEMNTIGIYPMVWDEPADELFEWLSDSFARLRAYLLDAAANGRGILVAIM
ncbi:MAG: YfbM family protein [Phycisphaerales bacterium]